MVTEGNTWEIHDLREMGGTTILQISLADASPGQVARSLLALGRPAIPVLEAPPPSLIQSQDLAHSIPAQPATTLSLKEIEERMETGQIPPKSIPPRKVILPDGSEKPTRTWRDLLLKTAEWSQPWVGTKLPLTWPSTGRLVVAREDSGMTVPKPVGSYWVETSVGTLYLVKYARLILERIGKDPSTVQVVLR